VLYFACCIFVFLSFTFPVNGCAADQGSDELDLDFEIPEVEKKPYAFGGELEISETVQGLDDDSLLFHQKYPDGRDRKTLFQSEIRLKVEGSYQTGLLKLYGRLRGYLDYNDEEKWGSDHRTEEAYVSLQPLPSVTVEAGKKVLSWGKGYAWNPAAFFSRPKDLEDPDATLEGYYVIAGDLIKSMAGPFKTVALTPVLLPVSKHINDQWGTESEIVWGGKIYIFTWDMDLDIMFLVGETVKDRLGFDFSKNILPNFEIHGEAAFIPDAIKHITDSSGDLDIQEENAFNYLLGVRYLTSLDTTLIFEYYRNGQGFTTDEMEDYFALTESGYSAYVNNENISELAKSRLYGSQFYNLQSVMRDYFFLKISQKDPFGILYFTPSVTCIYNINDQSASIKPQLTYTPVNNLELDLKTMFTLGNDFTEYGEKLNAYKIEASITCYF